MGGGADRGREEEEAEEEEGVEEEEPKLKPKAKPRESPSPHNAIRCSLFALCCSGAECDVEGCRCRKEGIWQRGKEAIGCTRPLAKAWDL